MSDSLFPPPLVPEAALRNLKLAAQSAALARLELSHALRTHIEEWTPEAIEEAARILNSITHLHDAIRALLPS